MSQFGECGKTAASNSSIHLTDDLGAASGTFDDMRGSLGVAFGSEDSSEHPKLRPAKCLAGRCGRTDRTMVLDQHDGPVFRLLPLRQCTFRQSEDQQVANALCQAFAPTIAALQPARVSSSLR